MTLPEILSDPDLSQADIVQIKKMEAIMIGRGHENATIILEDKRRVRFVYKQGVMECEFLPSDIFSNRVRMEDYLPKIKVKK